MVLLRSSEVAFSPATELCRGGQETGPWDPRRVTYTRSLLGMTWWHMPLILLSLGIGNIEIIWTWPSSFVEKV